MRRALLPALAVAALAAGLTPAAATGCGSFGYLPPYTVCRTFLANDDPYVIAGTPYVNGTPFRSYGPATVTTTTVTTTTVEGPSAYDEPWFRPAFDGPGFRVVSRRHAWRPRRSGWY